MLRKLRLNNFVLFKEEHALEFSDGAHFFIGPNESGKSSLFELIRRCLGTSMSTTLSTAFNDNKPSVVCALFQTTLDYQKSDVLTSDNKKSDKKASDNQKSDEKASSNHESDEQESDDPQLVGQTSSDHKSNANIKTSEGEKSDEKASANQKSDATRIVSALIKLPQANKKKLYIKIACTIPHDKGIDLVKENIMGIIVNEEYKVNPENESANEIFKILEEYINGKVDSTQLIDKIKKLITEEERQMFLIKDVAVDKCTECNNILKNLDDKVVNTFPNRGIGALQWSHSKFNDYRAKESNYESAQKRSEIRTWYKEREDISPEERSEERKLYELITGKSKDEQRNQSLLKVPEGLIEAENCSILLAVSRFKTVILEDPERGMHPQMIERLRDLVLPQVKDKVVLVSSHHPHFVCSSNICSVFLLRQIEHGTKILQVGDILNSEKVNTETERNNMMYRLTTSDFRSVFFAERVIIVEGKWDVMFMESLKMTLLDLNNKLMSKFHEGADENAIRAALTTLVILSADGIYNIDPLINLCSELHINACSLKDNKKIKYRQSDQIESTDNETAEPVMGSDDAAKRCSQGGGNNKQEHIWNGGELEDVFVNFSNWLWKKSPSKCKPFRDNLQKVLNVSEKDGKLEKGDKRDPKFGKIGSRNDRDSVISTILEISAEKEQLDDEDGMEFRNFVKFLFDFLSDKQTALVKT